MRRRRPIVEHVARRTVLLRVGAMCAIEKLALSLSGIVKALRT